MGSFIYPECNSSSIASGDVSVLMQQMSDLDTRKALAGNDRNNWYTWTTTRNDAWPLTFEFINNDISDSFEFKFTSPTFPDGLSCSWDSAVSTCNDFVIFSTADKHDEVIRIQEFTVNQYVLSVCSQEICCHLCFFSNLCAYNIKLI